MNLVVPEAKNTRLPVLDGWRGISIILVLIGHMLPLGPKWLALNSMVSAAGLSIFFFLSGYLVVLMLHRKPGITSFLIRRFFRVVPLAWVALAVLTAMNQPTFDVWLANLLFFANLYPNALMPNGEHLWSLSIEFQFYITVAIAVVIFGPRALFFVPLACLAVTVLRVTTGSGYSIVTWLRVDEILVGGMVALIRRKDTGIVNGNPCSILVTLTLVPLLFVCCHERFLFGNYLRPYVAAALVYSSLDRVKDDLHQILTCRFLSYIAKISYSLYVIHPFTYAGWLGDGDTIVRYTKRLISFVLTFGGAHLISRFFEGPLNHLGHRLANRFDTNGDVRRQVGCE